MVIFPEFGVASSTQWQGNKFSSKRVAWIMVRKELATMADFPFRAVQADHFSMLVPPGTKMSPVTNLEL